MNSRKASVEPVASDQPDNSRWECGVCHRPFLLKKPFLLHTLCGYCGDEAIPWEEPRQHTDVEILQDKYEMIAMEVEVL